MNRITAFVDSLTTGNWIAIIAIFVAIFFGSFAAANYLAGRKERKLKTSETAPRLKATINRKCYQGGWRSVQLHIDPPGEQQNFDYDRWCIKRAILLCPRSARLARAKDDDYATGIFYPNAPVRQLQGKDEGRKQRFALEFFIRFQGDDQGREAKFKVTFEHVSGQRKYTSRVWATVPRDAE